MSVYSEAGDGDAPYEAVSVRSAVSGKSTVSGKSAVSGKYAAPPPAPPPSRPPSVVPPTPPPSDKPPPQPVKPEPPSSDKGESHLDCFCIMWSFIWLGVLIVFAWPFSVAISALYGFVSPMISLIGIEDISDSLLEGVNVGRQCARNVRNGVPMI